MAREREKESTKGLASLELEDAIDVGLFDAGPATITESLFADYDYGGNAKAVPVWLITYERDGETYEQPYSLGKGWRVVNDGEGLKSKTGQTGLAKSCNAVKYLLTSLRAAGMPRGAFAGNPRVLEKAEVVLDRVPQEKRKGLQSGSDDKERSILVIEEIVSASWDKGGKKKTAAGSTSAKKKVEEEDEDEEDEQPKRGRSSSSSSRASKDEDEDAEDDKSARGAKGKSKDSDSDADADLDEEAVEALIEALDAGKLAVDDIGAAVRKATKGNPQGKAIAARCEEDDFLEQEKGWTFNKKKGTVELD